MYIDFKVLKLPHANFYLSYLTISKHEILILDNY